MRRVIVNVYVPALCISYDIFIPADCRIFEAAELIIKAVAELSSGQFIPNCDTALVMRKSGKILDLNRKVSDIGIANGSKLMLI